MIGKRPRHTGSIYQRPGSTNLWISYYKHGVCVRESSRSDNKIEAEKLLRQRLAGIEDPVALLWFEEIKARLDSLEKLVEDRFQALLYAIKRKAGVQ